MRWDRIALPVTAPATPRATVLFADLRGYTAMAEQLAPAYLARLLDEFFSALTSVVELHGGQVFHTAGDSLMAGFGVSDPVQDGTQEAVAAGRSMLARFESLGERWQRDSHVEAGVGIGLHLGEVALAAFGPPARRIFTLVGDTANVAARLCGRARAGEVLFSCTVAAALAARSPDSALAESSSEPIAFLQLPRYELRGRRAPLDIWCIPASKRIELPGTPPGENSALVRTRRATLRI
jgi:adenylate cyclase